jgi:hypothetical protein
MDSKDRVGQGYPVHKQLPVAGVYCTGGHVDRVITKNFISIRVVKRFIEFTLSSCPTDKI